MNQAQLDGMAKQIMALHGDNQETITYTHLETQDDTPQVLNLGPVRLEAFSRQEVSLDAMLLTDRRLRLPVYVLALEATWTPGRFDSFTRSNSEVWRLLEIDGGPGTPFYLCRCRRFG